ncbi:MAG: protein-disulfide isomerase, partial [Thaumarchaeota archaeon]|nr:protein-disulfide isomerase [Nitrososphaerota archaeon]
LKFYINQQLVEDIRKYIVQEDDRILITYGNEDQLAIDKQLAELNAQAINRL